SFELLGSLFVHLWSVCLFRAAFVVAFFLGRCVLGSSLVRPNRFLGGYWWMRSGAPVNGWRCWYVGLRRTNWNVVVGCVFFSFFRLRWCAQCGRFRNFCPVVQWGRGCFFRHAERELVRDVKLDFLQLRWAYPGMVVVWSDIVARTSWHWARSVERLNKARIKVNREVGRFFSHHGGLVVRHLELEVDTWRYLRCDGVHLNAVGTDFMVPGSAGWHTAGCSFVAWHAWV
ncbi:unnamed protein product, partial [Staurois parvus]